VLNKRFCAVVRSAEVEQYNHRERKQKMKNNFLLIRMELLRLQIFVRFLKFL